MSCKFVQRIERVQYVMQHALTIWLYLTEHILPTGELLFLTCFVFSI